MTASRERAAVDLRLRLRTTLLGLEDKDLASQSEWGVCRILQQLQTSHELDHCLRDVLDGLEHCNIGARKLRFRIAAAAVKQHGYQRVAGSLGFLMHVILQRAAVEKYDSIVVELAGLTRELTSAVLLYQADAGAFDRTLGALQQNPNWLGELLIQPLIKTAARGPAKQRAANAFFLVHAVLGVFFEWANSPAVQVAVLACLKSMLRVLASGTPALLVPEAYMPIRQCIEIRGADLSPSIIRQALLECIDGIKHKEDWQVRKQAVEALTTLAASVQVHRPTAEGEWKLEESPGIHMFSANKALILSALNTARYDKIQHVRHATAKALYEIDCIPDPAGPLVNSMLDVVAEHSRRTAGAATASVASENSLQGSLFSPWNTDPPPQRQPIASSRPQTQPRVPFKRIQNTPRSLADDAGKRPRDTSPPPAFTRPKLSRRDRRQLDFGVLVYAPEHRSPTLPICLPSQAQLLVPKDSLQEHARHSPKQEFEDGPVLPVAEFSSARSPVSSPTRAAHSGSNADLPPKAPGSPDAPASPARIGRQQGSADGQDSPQQSSKHDKPSPPRQQDDSVHDRQGAAYSCPVPKAHDMQMGCIDVQLHPDPAHMEVRVWPDASRGSIEGLRAWMRGPAHALDMGVEIQVPSDRSGALAHVQRYQFADGALFRTQSPVKATGPGGLGATGSSMAVVPAEACSPFKQPAGGTDQPAGHFWEHRHPQAQGGRDGMPEHMAESETRPAEHSQQGPVHSPPQQQQRQHVVRPAVAWTVGEPFPEDGPSPASNAEEHEMPPSGPWAALEVPGSPQLEAQAENAAPGSSPLPSSAGDPGGPQAADYEALWDDTPGNSAARSPTNDHDPPGPQQAQPVQNPHQDEQRVRQRSPDQRYRQPADLTSQPSSMPGPVGSQPRSAPPHGAPQRKEAQADADADPSHAAGTPEQLLASLPPASPVKEPIRSPPSNSSSPGPDFAGSPAGRRTTGSAGPSWPSQDVRGLTPKAQNALGRPPQPDPKPQVISPVAATAADRADHGQQPCDGPNKSPAKARSSPGSHSSHGSPAQEQHASPSSQGALSPLAALLAKLRGKASNSKADKPMNPAQAAVAVDPDAGAPQQPQRTAGNAEELVSQPAPMLQHGSSSSTAGLGTSPDDDQLRQLEQRFDEALARAKRQLEDGRLANAAEAALLQSEASSESDIGPYSLASSSDQRQAQRSRLVPASSRKAAPHLGSEHAQQSGIDQMREQATTHQQADVFNDSALPDAEAARTGYPLAGEDSRASSPGVDAESSGRDSRVGGGAGWEQSLTDFHDALSIDGSSLSGSHVFEDMAPEQPSLGAPASRPGSRAGSTRAAREAAHSRGSSIAGDYQDPRVNSRRGSVAGERPGSVQRRCEAAPQQGAFSHPATSEVDFQDAAISSSPGSVASNRLGSTQQHSKAVSEQDASRHIAPSTGDLLDPHKRLSSDPQHSDATSEQGGPSHRASSAGSHDGFAGLTLRHLPLASLGPGLAAYHEEAPDARVGFAAAETPRVGVGPGQGARARRATAEVPAWHPAAAMAQPASQRGASGDGDALLGQAHLAGSHVALHEPGSLRRIAQRGSNSGQRSAPRQLPPDIEAFLTAHEASTSASAPAADTASTSALCEGVGRVSATSSQASLTSSSNPASETSSGRQARPVWVVDRAMVPTLVAYADGASPQSGAEAADLDLREPASSSQLPQGRHQPRDGGDTGDSNRPFADMAMVRQQQQAAGRQHRLTLDGPDHPASLPIHQHHEAPPYVSVPEQPTTAGGPAARLATRQGPGAPLLQPSTSRRLTLDSLAPSVPLPTDPARRLTADAADLQSRASKGRQTAGQASELAHTRRAHAAHAAAAAPTRGALRLRRITGSYSSSDDNDEPEKQVRQDQRQRSAAKSVQPQLAASPGPRSLHARKPAVGTPPPGSPGSGQLSSPVSLRSMAASSSDRRAPAAVDGHPGRSHRAVPPHQPSASDFALSKDHSSFNDWVHGQRRTATHEHAGMRSADDQALQRDPLLAKQMGKLAPSPDRSAARAVASDSDSSQEAAARLNVHCNPLWNHEAGLASKAASPVKLPPSSRAQLGQRPRSSSQLGARGFSPARKPSAARKAARQSTSSDSDDARDAETIAATVYGGTPSKEKQAVSVAEQAAARRRWTADVPAPIQLTHSLLSGAYAASSTLKVALKHSSQPPSRQSASDSSDQEGSDAERPAGRASTGGSAHQAAAYARQASSRGQSASAKLASRGAPADSSAQEQGLKPRSTLDDLPIDDDLKMRLAVLLQINR